MKKETINGGLAKKLKSESMVKRLKDEGINVDSLQKNIKKKQDDNGQGITK